MPDAFRQAPRLVHDKGRYASYGYYQLPQGLMDVVYRKLDGRNGSQIKLMTVLLGTKGDGSFRVSEKWIMDRTGLSQPAYMSARKQLIEKGWLSLDQGVLTVNVSNIVGDGI